MRLKNLKTAKNISQLTLKTFFKSFESRSILSIKNWIAPSNPKRSKIPKSSKRHEIFIHLKFLFI